MILSPHSGRCNAQQTTLTIQRGGPCSMFDVHLHAALTGKPRDGLPTFRPCRSLNFSERRLVSPAEFLPGAPSDENADSSLRGRWSVCL